MHVQKVDHPVSSDPRPNIQEAKPARQLFFKKQGDFILTAYLMGKVKFDTGIVQGLTKQLGIKEKLSASSNIFSTPSFHSFVLLDCISLHCLLLFVLDVEWKKGCCCLMCCCGCVFFVVVLSFVVLSRDAKQLISWRETNLLQKHPKSRLFGFIRFFVSILPK
jgi:hypothetical protein